VGNALGKIHQRAGEQTRLSKKNGARHLDVRSV
jgi:hypothetical protein